MNIRLNNINIKIFGTSHGEAIGGVVSGIPSGITINNEYMKEMLKRRRPGNKAHGTKRQELDEVVFLSGLFNNVTTGEDISGLIYNTNKISKDYAYLLETPRPAHADLTAHFKYNGMNDVNGGGAYSGRLTAPMVFIGAIAKQILEEKYNIQIVSHLSSVGNIDDDLLNDLEYDIEQKGSILSNPIPIINKELINDLDNLLKETRMSLNSIGATIETCIYNLPMGLGEHSDSSIESMMSKSVFCIPGIKGIEFGKGFSLARMNGSESNDSIYYDEDKKIKTRTNYMGGLLGGMTNSMPLNFKVCLKPTPSIALEQDTINLKTKENVKLNIKGRHDPCIGIRAVPVLEAISALVILDAIIEGEK